MPLSLFLHGCKVASANKARLIAMRILHLWVPAIPAWNRLTAESVGDNAADGREVFGAVEGSPRSTNQILKLRVPGYNGILGFCDAIPKNLV